MPIETDALIIGAGPVGLFQAFQLGLQDVRVHIVDALPYAGGQCIELYADKPIYDIPGIPLCTGRELVAQLLQQADPFRPQFHFSSVVSALAQQADGRYLVTTVPTSNGPEGTVEQGRTFLAKTVFIAAGVGAFQARTLKLDGAEMVQGRHLHYRFGADTPCNGTHVVIHGDGDPALTAAVQLAERNAALPLAQRQHISVLHRRDVFNAEPALLARFRGLLSTGNLHFVAGQITALQLQGDALTAIEVLHADGTTAPLPCQLLLVLQGLSPKLGPIADWGLDMERRQLKVDTETFSTAQPGIFAVGDINTYAGKKKLILCGFHECVLAAFAAMAIIRPQEKVLLQYTTTSSKLHRLLGVTHSASSS